ncbi:MAG: shikimate dehydrogenase, partial [Flavobacteriaceae bacterium]|nr:shikimate dehydrogenase [Flavobacteriaceae bacterium]
MAKFGLIGKDLSHSFSRTFFTHKFDKDKRKHSYHNFELDEIDEFPGLIRNIKGLKGLNVTI